MVAAVDAAFEQVNMQSRQRVGKLNEGTLKLNTTQIMFASWFEQQLGSSVRMKLKSLIRATLAKVG